MKVERNQIIEKKISLGQLIIAISIIITGILIFKGCTVVAKVAEDIGIAVTGLGGYLRYLANLS